MNINGIRGKQFYHTWNTPVHMIGDLPPGLTFTNNTITGVPEIIGIYNLQIIKNNEIEDLNISIREQLFRGFYRQADS